MRPGPSSMSAGCAEESAGDESGCRPARPLHRPATKGGGDVRRVSLHRWRRGPVDAARRLFDRHRKSSPGHRTKVPSGHRCHAAVGRPLPLAGHHLGFRQAPTGPSWSLAACSSRHLGGQILMHATLIWAAIALSAIRAMAAASGTTPTLPRSVVFISAWYSRRCFVACGKR
jgi:hypothetical protein